MSAKIAVLGAGAWGTALAVNLTRSGHDVVLWGRDESQIRQMTENRENAKYLPNVTLPDELAFTADITQAVANRPIVLLVIPAQKMAETAKTIAEICVDNVTLVSCAKGIEQSSGAIMSDLLSQKCPKATIASLSGPSFAADVVRGLPTAVTIASNKMENALTLCETLSNKQLRCYASDDLIGVDYGGALKNVLAIAAGIVHGKNLGASALAAITARGFSELQRIALQLGAKPETLTGLSGLGDLILTCASEKSRNFAYGAAIGRGDDLSTLKLAEGVATAAIAAKIAKDNQIDAPLIQAVSDILSGHVNIDDTITRIMTRPIKTET